MKYISLVARILLGLIFIVLGLNKLYPFLHMPMPTGFALQFYIDLMTAHIITVIACLEVISALLLFFNRYVALALVLLGPIIVNAFLYEVFLDPKHLPLIVVTLFLYIIVLRHHKPAFEPLLQKNS